MEQLGSFCSNKYRPQVLTSSVISAPRWLQLKSSSASLWPRRRAFFPTIHGNVSAWFQFHFVRRQFLQQGGSLEQKRVKKRLFTGWVKLWRMEEDLLPSLYGALETRLREHEKCHSRFILLLCPLQSVAGSSMDPFMCKLIR